MNIGEYLRETMSAAAYDELIERLAGVVAEEPPDSEDPLTEVLPAIETRLQQATERTRRIIRSQWLKLDPYVRPTSREQGRHLAYRRLDGQYVFDVVERVPIDDGTEFGSWRERPITRVFWHATERRWRCGCREFVRTRSCEHIAALAVFSAASPARRPMMHDELQDSLCVCGSPEFVSGLCYACHLLTEQRWSEQWPSERRAQ